MDLVSEHIHFYYKYIYGGIGHDSHLAMTFIAPSVVDVGEFSIGGILCYYTDNRVRRNKGV